MNSRRKDILEGALFSALSFILFAFSLLLSGMVPVLGNAVTLLSSIPMIIIAYRWNANTSLLSLLVATLLVSQFLGPAAGLFYLPFFGLCGWLTGFLLKKRLNPSAVIIFSTICCTLVFMAATWLLTAVFSMDLPVARFDETARQQLAGIEHSISPAAASGTNAGLAESVVNTILFLGPGLLVVFTAFSSLIYYVLGCFVLRYYLRAEMRPLTAYSLPWKFIFLLAVPLALCEYYWFFMDAGIHNIPAGFSGRLFRASTNILFASVTFYFFQGIAIAGTLIRRLKQSPAILLFVFLFSFVFPPWLLFLTVIGLFDSWFDFRKNKGGFPNEGYTS